MNEVWIKFIGEAPWAAAMALIVYMFLNHQREIEKTRDANAASMARERREYEQQKDVMYANWIRSLIDAQGEGFQKIANAFAEHDREEKRRYEMLGITKDLAKKAEEKGVGD